MLGRCSTDDERDTGRFPFCMTFACTRSDRIAFTVSSKIACEHPITYQYARKSFHIGRYVNEEPATITVHVHIVSRAENAVIPNTRKMLLIKISLQYY